MDLSVEEKDIVREVIIKHRLILAGSGYGKIIIEYSQGKVDITSQRSDKSTVKFSEEKKNYVNG